MDLRSLDELAREHHGLVTLRAANDRGISRAAWYRAIAAGSLEPMHPGVARLFGSAPTREQRIAAAVLGAGTGAVASHRSAAHLWGIPRPDDDAIDVTLLDRRRQATLDGVVVHRPRDRLDITPVVRHHIRTSGVLRLLCDLGAVDPPSVPAAVDHVLTNGLASPEALRTAIDAHARRGRHGVPALRDALADRVLDGRA